MDSYMRGANHALRAEIDFTAFTDNPLAYLQGYLRNKFPSNFSNREDIDLHAPQRRITLKPTLLMQLQKAVMLPIVYPYVVTLNGRSLTKEENRKFWRNYWSNPC